MDANSIMWFRRDLRLADNHALAAAIADARDSGGSSRCSSSTTRCGKAAGANRRWFVAGCLRSLHDDLDGRLVVRHGDPVDVIPRARPAARRGSCLPRPGRRGLRSASRRGRRRRARRGRPPARRGRQPVRRAGRDVAHERWRDVQGVQRLPAGVAPAAPAGDRPPPGRRSRRSTGCAPTSSPRRPTSTADLPEPGEAAAHRALDRFVDTRVDTYADDPQRPGRRRDEPPVAVPQVRLPPPPPAAAPARRAQPLPRHVRQGAGVARLLRRRARRLAGVGVALVEPGDGRHGGRPRTAGRRALRRLVRRPHRLPDRRRRDAPAASPRAGCTTACA